jgi:hypothetical protein
VYPESDNETFIALVKEVEDRIFEDPGLDACWEGFYWLTDRDG